MKRLLLSIALTLVSTAAFAQLADRDVLVTPDGVVYTVDSQAPPEASSFEARSILSLNVQNGDQIKQVTVPDSESAGYHVRGVLAYDSDSGTLFVLWIHLSLDGLSSELRVASYRDGKWQPSVAIDNEQYRVRKNLHLGITRRVSQLQKDGTYADVPALLLHALWWEESGKGEEARYAMIAIDKGALSSIETHSLEEFVPPADEVFNEVVPNFNKEILRQPVITSSPAQDSVDIVFGDTKSNSFHSISLRPVADARVHIPVGIGNGPSGRPRILALKDFTADWTGPITVLTRGDSLVFANVGEKAVSYISYSNETWSSVKSIAIDSKFPPEAAFAALERMMITR